MIHIFLLFYYVKERHRRMTLYTQDLHTFAGISCPIQLQYSIVVIIHKYLTKECCIDQSESTISISHVSIYSKICFWFLSRTIFPLLSTFGQTLDKHPIWGHLKSAFLHHLIINRWFSRDFVHVCFWEPLCCASDQFQSAPKILIIRNCTEQDTFITMPYQMIY